MKLSEKFARQESEDARLARIGRRRISKAQSESVRRFLGGDGSQKPARPRRAARRAGDATSGPLACDECGRRFQLPMHLGRHRKWAHDGASNDNGASNGAGSSNGAQPPQA
jgi:hypothetical protein